MQYLSKNSKTRGSVEPALLTWLLICSLCWICEISHTPDARSV